MVLVTIAATPAEATTNSRPSQVIGGALPLTMGVAPGMPDELRREAQRNWRLFQGERRLAGATKSCTVRAAWTAYRFKNLAGQTLWTYYQQVYFCRVLRAGLVTYFYRVRWAEVGSITPIVDWKPWEFKGHIGSNCEGEHCFIRGHRAKSRTAWTQGSFQVCALKIALCNYQNPMVGITVYGNGPIERFSRGG